MWSLLSRHYSSKLLVGSKRWASSAMIRKGRLNVTACSRSMSVLAASSTTAHEDANSKTTTLLAAATGLILLGTVWSHGNKTCTEGTLLMSTSTGSSELDHDSDADANMDDTTTTILNWSGTHNVIVPNENYWEPESIEQVQHIVQQCHTKGIPVRPVGSALSPNGLAFQEGGMMSMIHLDNILEVDAKQKTVTVQAGARVSQVIEALRPYKLTLPNLASIAEQQMGGFVQVGAHGTGKAIAPVDHYVTKLKLVTPGQGTIELTDHEEREEDQELFHLAKVGLGCLGIVVEVTMQCIPAHKLVEHTFVLTRQQAKEQLDELLQKHKHVRYMWIPFEDAVVVVTNDPESHLPHNVPREASKVSSDKERFQPLTDLLLQLSQEYQDNPTSTAPTYTKESIPGMGFGELRDALLAFDPLHMEHVQRVNKAEAEFWRRSEGYQTKPSDQLLQFDCGGQVRTVGD